MRQLAPTYAEPHCGSGIRPKKFSLDTLKAHRIIQYLSEKRKRKVNHIIGKVSYKQYRQNLSIKKTVSRKSRRAGIKEQFLVVSF